MVQVQRYTGARPGEICAMRVGEIDRSTEVWTCTPSTHKTAHHGHSRVIFIGPKAQEILSPFLLKLDPEAFVFSPAEAVREMRQRRSEERRTRSNCGNFAGSNRKCNPKRVPSERYNVPSYRRAVTRAADNADLWAKGGRVIANVRRAGTYRLSASIHFDGPRTFRFLRRLGRCSQRSVGSSPAARTAPRLEATSTNSVRSGF
jgi:integrase